MQADRRRVSLEEGKRAGFDPTVRTWDLITGAPNLSGRMLPLAESAPCCRGTRTKAIMWQPIFTRLKRASTR